MQPWQLAWALGLPGLRGASCCRGLSGGAWLRPGLRRQRLPEGGRASSSRRLQP